MVQKTGRRKRTRDATPREVTVEQAERENPGKWILMKVTRADEYGAPAGGVVVAAKKRREAISRKLIDVMPAVRAEGATAFVFSGEREVDLDDQLNAYLSLATDEPATD